MYVLIALFICLSAKLRLRGLRWTMRKMEDSDG